VPGSGRRSVSQEAVQTVVLRLYPPYSTIVGSKEVRVSLGSPGDGRTVQAPQFFLRFCDKHPALKELFFPSGLEQDFPGYTSVLRDGVPLRGTDVIRPGDALEVLTALSGG
jgi:hypothetical protein